MVASDECIIALTFLNCTIRWMCGVVFIVFASHSEDRKFDSSLGCT
jgi:hypothetical protein